MLITIAQLDTIIACGGDLTDDMRTVTAVYRLWKAGAAKKCCNKTTLKTPAFEVTLSSAIGRMPEDVRKEFGARLRKALNTDNRLFINLINFKQAI